MHAAGCRVCNGELEAKRSRVSVSQWAGAGASRAGQAEFHCPLRLSLTGLPPQPGAPVHAQLRCCDSGLEGTPLLLFAVP